MKANHHHLAGLHLGICVCLFQIDVTLSTSTFIKQFILHARKCLCFISARVYLLLGGQFSYAVGFEKREVDHSLEQRNCLLGVTRLTQEMTLLGEDVWTKRKGRLTGQTSKNRTDQTNQVWQKHKNKKLSRVTG